MRPPGRAKDRGFTLIELLVVIIIVGLLAAIAIPVFLSQRKKGYDAQAKSALHNVATAEESFLVENTAAYATCASAVACIGTGSLGGSGFKVTSGVKVAVIADSLKGYCAITQSQSGNYYIYDSEAGGLQAYASTTVPSAANDGVSAGACVNITGFPAPA